MPLPEFWEKYRKESKTMRPIFERRPEDPAVVIGNMLKFKNKPANKNRLQPKEIKPIDFKLEKDKFLSQEK